MASASAYYFSANIRSFPANKRITIDFDLIPENKLIESSFKQSSPLHNSQFEIAISIPLSN